MWPETFSRAFLGPESKRHVVLGRRLRPYSLWHQFLLAATEHPLSVEGSQFTFTDLVTAVNICRLRYPQKPPRRPYGIVSLICGLRASDWETEAQKFFDYAGSYNQCPEFWIQENQRSFKGQMPKPLAVASALISIGFAEHVAWDMPVGKASYYEAAHHQLNGADLDFVTPIGDDIQARLDVSDRWWPLLIESIRALKINEEAVQRLDNANLLTSTAKEYLDDFRKCRKGAERKLMIQEMAHEFPGLVENPFTNHG